MEKINTITVAAEDGVHEEQLTLEQWVAMAPDHFPIAERVQGASGRAFDLLSWFQVWKEQRGAASSPMPTPTPTPTPTHLIVKAADEFQATIPWEQLAQAAVLYEQDGEPLRKGYPVRLYVPNGTSECLNVKSVVYLRFARDDRSRGDASYGFHNSISPAALRGGLRK